MMSHNEPRQQTLEWIEDGLTGSDPRLASMLNIFSRLTAGEEMPAREKIHVRPGRQPRRPGPHPGVRRGLLLLWVVISAAVLAVALVLSIGGHKGCIQSMGATCASPPPHSLPAHPT